MSTVLERLQEMRSNRKKGRGHAGLSFMNTKTVEFRTQRQRNFTESQRVQWISFSILAFGLAALLASR